MFIPRELKTWKRRNNPETRCHTCVRTPIRKSEMLKVMEGPMSWHFCSDHCGMVWHERRHDLDAQAWFKVAKGIRAQLLKLKHDVPPHSITTEDRRALAGLSLDARVALSMRESP